MQNLMRHYPDWKAPSEDGELFLWPPANQILNDARHNQAQLGACERVRFGGVPLGDVRRRMREFVGHDDALPMIVAAHQAELHHAGVWVKNIVINRIAERLGGQAYHVSVDTDGPKHLSLRWPGGAVPISDDPRLTSAAWLALLDPPTPAHIQRIESQFAAVSRTWDFQPLLPELLASLRRLSLEAVNFAAVLVNAMHELDWKLGLRHHALLASPIWSSEPYLVFAHDLLAHAGVVGARYNAALAGFRDEHGLRSNTRPMPDLAVSDDSAEVPFWLDDLHTGTRLRPSLFREDGGWVLQLTGGERFCFDPAADGWDAGQRLGRWLGSTRRRLTPRALTHTMFERLLVADQFVHGIGGGQYDQVTDRLIASHYGIEPPRFAVASATMYFPAALSRQRVCLPCIYIEGHRLKHSLLGRRKREMVEEISTLPRKSPERAQQFSRMHRELAAAASDSPVLQGWQEKLHAAQEQLIEQQALFDRELFYALQPRARLDEMIERVRGHFA